MRDAEANMRRPPLGSIFSNADPALHLLEQLAPANPDEWRAVHTPVPIAGCVIEFGSVSLIEDTIAVEAAIAMFGRVTPITVRSILYSRSPCHGFRHGVAHAASGESIITVANSAPCTRPVQVCSHGRRRARAAKRSFRLFANSLD